MSINFEELSADPLRDPHAFHDFVTERAPAYLHVDEVQELPEWPRVINSLRTRGDMEICVTGSNASLFAARDATYLAGRYVTMEVLLLPLAEYRTFHPESRGARADEVYQSMLATGTLPATAMAATTISADDLNSALFDSVFTRDIVMAGSIRETGVFLRVARVVFDNAGSVLGPSKISRTLTSEGVKVSYTTVDKYLGLLVNAHLIYACQPFDVRGRALLTTGMKYYWSDPGLRRALLGTAHGNVVHDLENMVYLEPLRRGYDVTTGLNGSREIDFRVTRNEKQAFI